MRQLELRVVPENRIEVYSHFLLFNSGHKAPSLEQETAGGGGNNGCSWAPLQRAVVATRRCDN